MFILHKRLPLLGILVLNTLLCTLGLYQQLQQDSGTLEYPYLWASFLNRLCHKNDPTSSQSYCLLLKEVEVTDQYTVRFPMSFSIPLWHY